MNLEKDLYTVEDLARLFEVTKPTIYDWMNRRGLAWIRVGGRRRVTRAAIEAFIEEGKDRAANPKYNPGDIRTPLVATLAR